MAKARYEESKAADYQLERIVAEVATKMGNDTIQKVQEAWRAFAEAEANRNAELYAGGSIYPSIYHYTLTGLSTDRIQQLKTWLDEQPDFASPD